MDIRRIIALLFGFSGFVIIATSHFGFVVEVTNTALFGIVVVVFALTQFPEEDKN